MKLCIECRHYRHPHICVSPKKGSHPCLVTGKVRGDNAAATRGERFCGPSGRWWEPWGFWGRLIGLQLMAD